MTITPAKAGEVWKGWLIKDINGDGLSKTIPVIISDRLTDILALVVFSLSRNTLLQTGSLCYHNYFNSLWRVYHSCQNRSSFKSINSYS